MKTSLIFTLCTLTLATVQDGDGGDGSKGSSTQGSQSQGAQDDSAQGYGQEQQSYGEYVEAGHQALAVESYRPEVCIGVCPPHAPFWELASGNCVPGICHREVLFHAYSEPSYDQHSGYRRLEESDNSYGYQAPEWSYQAPDQATPVSDTSQVDSCDNAPHGSVDTRNNYVSNSGRIALWIGFAILFLSSVWFINRYLWFYYLADASDGRVDFRLASEGGMAIYSFLAAPSLICGMVTFIASLAYLAMATHHGFYTRCFDGREFYYARYLDWLVTTPLMLHAIATGMNMEDNIWHYLFFNDILMIVAGLIGSTIGTGEKWIFFGFAMLSFIPLTYYLCWLKSREVDNRLFDGAGNVLAVTDLVEFFKDKSTAGSFIPSIFFLVGFNHVMRLTVIVWVFYPIVWILAEGTGTISANGEAIFYTVLDVISKAGFGILISNMKRNSYTELLANGYQLKDGSENLNFDNALQVAATVITNSGSSLI